MLQTATAAFFLAVTTLVPCNVHAQSDQDIIDAIRDAAAATLDQEKLGAGYAALIDFAVSPDISAAYYDLDETSGTSDAELRTTRFPYRHVFDRGGSGPRAFIQGVVAYQTLEAGFDVSVEDSIDSRWRTVGLALAGGLELPLSERLTLLPAISLGYGRLDNTASYRGSVANDLLRPALAGVLFDWEADAVDYGVALGLDYRREAGRFDLELLGSLAHHRLDSFNESSAFVAFQSAVTTVDVEFNAIHPTRLTLGDYPLSLVGLLGGTAFFGPERETLGFSSFVEAGLALDVDISSSGWSIKKLRLGAKAIAGADVSGWSLIFGHEF